MRNVLLFSLWASVKIKTATVSTTYEFTWEVFIQSPLIFLTTQFFTYSNPSNPYALFPVVLFWLIFFLMFWWKIIFFKRKCVWTFYFILFLRLWLSTCGFRFFCQIHWITNMPHSFKINTPIQISPQHQNIYFVFFTHQFSWKSMYCITRILEINKFLVPYFSRLTYLLIITSSCS